MPRDLHVDVATELEYAALLPDAHLRVCWLAEIEFESGTLYLWTGMGDLPWDSHTWTGVGILGGISPITEASDSRAAGITLSLSGVPSSLLGTVIGDSRQGKTVRVWMALFDADWAMIGEPAESFAGLFDVPRIEDDGQTCAISISAESDFMRLGETNARRYTDEDQQHEYPGDRGFEYAVGPEHSTVFAGKTIYTTGSGEQIIAT